MKKKMEDTSLGKLFKEHGKSTPKGQEGKKCKHDPKGFGYEGCISEYGLTYKLQDHSKCEGLCRELEVTPPREEFGGAEKIIGDCIAFAITDGQNMIQDLFADESKRDKLEFRIFKSFQYHYKNAMKALRSVRKQAIEEAINEAELWFLRLHNDPEKWSVKQAIKSLQDLLNQSTK